MYVLWAAGVGRSFRYFVEFGYMNVYSCLWPPVGNAPHTGQMILRKLIPKEL